MFASIDSVEVGFLPGLLAFLLGGLGSLAVEIVLLLQVFNAGKRVPARYTKWQFWLVRVLLMLVSGVFAWVYFDMNANVPKILFIHVGAATPTILLQMTTMPPSTDKDEVEG